MTEGLNSSLPCGYRCGIVGYEVCACVLSQCTQSVIAWAQGFSHRGKGKGLTGEHGQAGDMVETAAEGMIPSSVCN